MRNKKGFTLIELLAVIVILAIIALIATPLVLNIIKDTKVSANKTSVAMYADALDMQVSIYSLKHVTSHYIIDKNWADSNVKTKGNKVICDEVYYINSSGATLYNCKVDGSTDLYCYTNGKVYVDCSNTEYVTAYKHAKFSSDKKAPIFDLQNNIAISQNENYDLKLLVINLSDNMSANDDISIETNPTSTTDLDIGTHSIEVTVIDEAGNQLTKSVDIIIQKYVAPDTTYTFDAIGNEQQFIPEANGQYKLEVWGSSGSGIKDGAGGYSVGELNLTSEDILYIYVGNESGYNGGGIGISNGGGATDIRIGGNTLYHRLIVAGGGGGHGSDSSSYGGYGGGVDFGIVRNTGQSDCSSISSGTFGHGGNTSGTYTKKGGGGGGGWYGGSGNGWCAGNGGTGFVWVDGSTVPSGYLVENKYHLSNTSTESGKKGANGIAIITYLGK